MAKPVFVRAFASHGVPLTMNSCGFRFLYDAFDLIFYSYKTVNTDLPITGAPLTSIEYAKSAMKLVTYCIVTLIHYGSETLMVDTCYASY